MVLLNDSGQVTHMNILVLGDRHTGKSSLISTFVNPKSAIACGKETYFPTIEDSVVLQYIVNSNDNAQGFSSSSYLNNNAYSSSNSLATSTLMAQSKTESLQEALTNQNVIRDSVIDLESILSEISSNMDASSCDFSVDTLNEISFDDISVSQSIFTENVEKEKNLHTINLTITEVGGAEEFISLIPSAIDKADAFMFAYDVGNEDSFHNIWNYLKR